MSNLFSIVGNVLALIVVGVLLYAGYYLYKEYTATTGKKSKEAGGDGKGETTGSSSGTAGRAPAETSPRSNRGGENGWVGRGQTETDVQNAWWAVGHNMGPNGTDAQVPAGRAKYVSHWAAGQRGR